MTQFPYHPPLFVAFGLFASVQALRCRRVVPARAAWLLAMWFFSVLALVRIQDLLRLRELLPGRELPIDQDDLHFLSMVVLLYALHATWLLCLDGTNPSGKEPDLKPRHGPSTLAPLIRAYKVLFDWRRRSTSKTPLQAAAWYRCIAALDRALLSTLFLGRHRHSPSRFAFLRHRLLSIAGISLLGSLLRLSVRLTAPFFLGPFLLHDIRPQAESLLRRLPTGRVSHRELLLRAALVVYHNWASWAQYTAWHDFGALWFVGLGVDAPGDWPPLFGDPWQAWSLRRYWGVFWHRLAYRTYVGYSKSVADGVLGLRRGGVAYGVWVAFFVFCLSGLAHAVAARCTGLVCGYWNDARWYLMNFAAMGLEEVVWRLVGFPDSKRGAWLSRGIGYCWVFGFQFWSLPKAHYAKVHCFPLGVL